jgi:transposase InsO family protein
VELTERIVQVHEQSGGTYGAPRVHAELRAQGRRHSRKRIARLMRQAGCRGRAPKRWRTTTVPDPAATTPADLLRRDFTTAPEAVNTRWCGDITYINTWQGWLYLATVIDIASRKVVGWATANHPAWKPKRPSCAHSWPPAYAPAKANPGPNVPSRSR